MTFWGEEPSPDPQPDECECCGFGTNQLTAYRNDRKIIPRYHDDADEPYWYWYCELCAGTYASTAKLYGREDAQILEAICYVGNTILAAIKATNN